MTDKKDDKALMDLLNETLDYCNELADRINLVSKAFTALDQRLQKLERKVNEQIT